MSYSRFAIYYVPPKGPLATFGAHWLGWDIAQGCEVPQPQLSGVNEVTATPRKYGFHGTLKPPFRITAGRTIAELERATEQVAASLAPAICDGLVPTTLGRFMALTPHGNMAGLRRVAEHCVRDLDDFRAPPEAAELARRREKGLSQRQDALLMAWGYPYVMEEFRFHLTLSGSLPKETMAQWFGVLQTSLPPLPAPFVLDQIALCGERDDGRFEMIHRYTLAG